MLANVEPLEKTDPDLAAQFMAIVKGEIPALIHCGKVYETVSNNRKSALAHRIKREINLNLGRNDPCFCRSGKKYKKCCLNLEA